MFVFGHLGFGRALVTRWKRQHSVWWLGFGMLLPDLVDKPLYYARISPYFSCTRTIGHTTIFTIALFAAGRLFRSRPATAVAVGAATHVVLDCLLDVVTTQTPGPGAAVVAAVWPLLGPFTESYSASIPEHLARLFTWPIIVSELLGLGLIGWELLRARAQRAPGVQ